MARYTKTGTPSTIGAIDAQLDLIAVAIGDTLSRKADTPNQMEGSLDMNNNRILNLPIPISPSEPARLADITAATSVVDPNRTKTLVQRVMQYISMKVMVL